jgi:hypothetical protein
MIIVGTHRIVNCLLKTRLLNKYANQQIEYLDNVNSNKLEIKDTTDTGRYARYWHRWSVRNESLTRKSLILIFQLFVASFQQPTDMEINRRTENTMVKRKRTKGQAMIYKTLHRIPLKRSGCDYDKRIIFFNTKKFDLNFPIVCSIISTAHGYGKCISQMVDITISVIM